MIMTTKSGRFRAPHPGEVIDFRQNDSALGQVEGRVNSYLSFGAVDGPGIRFVVFLQGCPLRCLYCHNPDTVYGDAGETWTAEKLFGLIERHRSFIKSGGVTFSGGEPLAQRRFVLAMTLLLHRIGIHVAIDTSGCLPLELVKETIDEADMLLLDIKAFDPEVAVRLTGQDNVNALKVLDYCEETGKRVWVRHVLVRGFTLDEAQLAGMAAYLKTRRCVDMIELLPFHKMGEVKWERIGRQYSLSDVEATTAEEVVWAKSFFEKEGLRVQ